jgi:hypothetical protein
MLGSSRLTLTSIKNGTRVFDKGIGDTLHFSSKGINLLFEERVVTILNREGILSPSSIILDVDALPPVRCAKYEENILITDKFRLLVNNPIELRIKKNY